ncbi:MAG: hypothetical protein JWP74_4199 [Marmoricola sp.]|nr:hypothetical protein [Marmoricola sp.]
MTRALTVSRIRVVLEDGGSTRCGSWEPRECAPSTVNGPRSEPVAEALSRGVCPTWVGQRACSGPTPQQPDVSAP